MGWASGSSLLERVAGAVMPHIPKKHRREVAIDLVEAFEKEDCDTIGEVEDEDIQAAYRELHPEYFEDN